VWFASILIGMPLFASMGLAAFAFVHLASLSDQHRPAEDGAGDELVPAGGGAAVHPDGQHPRVPPSITDRIVAFATAVSRLAARRLRPCVDPDQHDLRRHGRLRGGRCRGLGAIEIRSMTRGLATGPRTAAAITAAAATIGPIIPAEPPHGDLRRDGRRARSGVSSARRRPWRPDGRCR